MLQLCLTAGSGISLAQGPSRLQPQAALGQNVIADHHHAGSCFHRSQKPPLSALTKSGCYDDLKVEHGHAQPQALSFLTCRLGGRDVHQPFQHTLKLLPKRQCVWTVILRGITKRKMGKAPRYAVLKYVSSYQGFHAAAPWALGTHHTAETWSGRESSSFTGLSWILI